MTDGAHWRWRETAAPVAPGVFLGPSADVARNSPMLDWLARHLGAPLVVSRLSSSDELELADLSLGAVPLWAQRLFLSARSLRDVRHVRIVRCRGVSSAQLCAFFERQPALRSLSVCGCDDLVLPHLRLPDLLVLKLARCALSAAAAAGLADSCPSLRELWLEGVDRAEAARLGGLRLEQLTLTNCVALLDAALAPLFAAADECGGADHGCAPPPVAPHAAPSLPPSLTHLDLSQCGRLVAPPLASAALASLSLDESTSLASLSFLGALPALTALSLAYCRCADLGASALRAEWPGTLAELSLARCDAWVDSLVLRAVADRCPRLRSLDVRGCDRVGAGGVQHVIDTCTRLRSLDVRAADGIGGVEGVDGTARDERDVDGRGSLRFSEEQLARISLSADAPIEARFYSLAAALRRRANDS